MPTRKWGSEKLVNTTTNGNQFDSAVAVLTTGQFVVVWQDQASVIRGQRFDASGVKIGTEFAIVDHASNQRPTIAALADGGFVVGFDRTLSGADTDPGFQRFLPSGAPVGMAASVDPETDLSGDVSVARAGTGFVVMYHDGNSNGGDVEIRVHDGNGFGPQRTASVTTANDQSQPAAAISTNQTTLALAWLDHTDSFLKGRLLNTVSGIFSGEFQISPDQGIVGVGNPTITWLSASKFVVVWSEVTIGANGVIAFRIFDNSTAARTDVIHIGPFHAEDGGYQKAPTVTALPDGGFVVSWQEDGGTVADPDIAIMLQAFDGLGNKIGRQFVVNTTTSGEQLAPSIAALPDGRIVVTWTDESASEGDISGSAIRMQIVDPRDGLVNGTPASETLYGHDLVNDEITGFAGNDLLIGLKGDDALYGGEGLDTLRGGFGADNLEGGAGSDTADYSDSTAAVNVNLTSGIGTGGFAVGDTYDSIESIAGSAFADALIGNALGNSFNGGAGADLMRGLAGSDAYTVDNAGDVVDESVVGSNGADLVGSFVTFSLSDPVRAKGLIEHVTLLGSAAIHAIGNSLSNTLVGNAAANFLVGREGSDAMTGGVGNDNFLFDTALGPTNVDTIRDFDVDGAGADSFDTIRLENAIFTQLTTTGDLAAARFLSVTNAADFDNGRTITYVSSTGGLYYDTNGAAAGGATLFAALTPGLAMTAADFFVT